MPIFSRGARCTNLLVPGMPMSSRGDRCTYLLELGSPVDIMRGAGIRGAGIRGFAVIVVFRGGSAMSFLGVVRLAFISTIRALSAGESVIGLGVRDLPLSGGVVTGILIVKRGIFMGFVEGIPLGIFLDGGVLAIFLPLRLALD